MLLGGTAFMVYHKRATMADISNENMRLAQAISSTISIFLEGPLNTLTAVSNISALPSASPAFINRLLEQMVTGYGFFESIMVLDSSSVVRSLGVASGVPLNRDEFIGIDLSGADAIARARKNNRHAWSDTFISPITGHPTLLLAVPSGSGMVVGTISLKDVSRIVAPEQKGSEHAYLVNQRGRIIACTHRLRVEQQASVSTLPSVSAGLLGKRGVFQYVADGEEVIGAVTAVAETGWLVVVERSQQEVFAHLKAIERGLVAAVTGCVLLVAALLLYVSRRVLKPVMAISEASRCMAAGSYPDIPSYGGNFAEIDDLSANFSEMSVILRQRESELREKNNELEHEIAERRLIERTLREQNEQLAIVEELLRKQLDETLEIHGELQTSKNLLQGMLDNSFGLQGLLTTTGVVLEANRSSLELLGVSRKEVVGKYFWDTPWWDHDPELCERLKNAIGRVAAGEGMERFEAVHRDRNGSLRLIDFSLKPVFGEDGTVRYLIPEGRDVTDHRLLEQQVMQQQKLEGIGLLAGGIAHDFNNLLSPIMIYADMIRSSANPDDRLYARASGILEAADKAKDLVRQLLSFSRKQTLTVQQHDVNEIVGSFMTILRRTIRENISISHRICADSCIVRGDRTQIEQVLLNLAVNAQDAMPENGGIVIETGHLVLDDEYCQMHPGTRPGNYVMLAFSDSGCGMDDGTLRHIFEPFFTTKPVGHGTGLGLSTVYGIVKQHEGFIDVQSTPGEGTTFRIFLPESSSAVTREAGAIPAAATEKEVSATILLVEDNVMVMEMVRELLAFSGHRVLAAGLPDEALVLAQEHPGQIDLLISDVVMPHMNGPELYERLREIVPGLRVLFMSGYANSVVVHAGHLEEGASFISKPFTSEAFLGRIGQLLRT